MDGGGEPKKIIAIIILVLSATLIAQTLISQDLAGWEPVGPRGRNVKSMAFNPLNHQEIYALVGDSTGNVYFSTDAGQYWTLRATLDSYCYDISVNPQQPDTIYILGKHGIFKSEDSGISWQQYRLGNSSFGSQGRIAINPVDSNTVYVTGSYYYSSGRSCMAIFKSTDGGENWTLNTLNSGFKRGNATCVAIDPVNPSIVYCGGYLCDDSLNTYSKVYKSTDSGENWSDITGTVDGNPKAIAIDAADPSKVYVGTTEGIYRSSNGGSSWQRNNGDACAYALCIDPSNPDIIHAGHHNCFHKSEDGGVNWTSLTEGINGSCNCLLAYSSPAQVFFGSNAGIYKSEDGGGSWSGSFIGFHLSSISALAVAQSSPRNIYSVVTGIGLFASDDFGTSWESKLTDAFWCSSLITVKVNPNNENDILIYPGPAG